MSEPEPAAAPRPQRPTRPRRKTAGKKSPRKAPDGGQGNAQDRGPKRIPEKPAATELRRRRFEADEEDATPVNRPSDGDPSPNKSRKKVLPNLAELKTALTHNLPTPPGTPVNRSPRTPSLQTLVSKVESKADMRHRRPKPLDTPPDEEPPPNAEDTPRTCYRIKKLLGRGAYGDVYLCKGPENNYYAMKTLKPAEKYDRFRKTRQDREQEIMEFFREHRKREDGIPESIIMFHETVQLPFKGEEKPRICHVIEWCEGPTLAHMLKQRGIRDSKVVRSISKQTLSGLAFLHDNRIIHCDMKPENIMLKNNQPLKLEDFVVRIIDFGLSEQLEPTEPYLKHVGGTPMYQPPEAFGDKRRITCKLDVWSFGVILWELLHGLNAFPICPISGDKARRIKKDEREARKYRDQVNAEEFKKQIKFDTDEWKQNSQAIPLAKGLLQKNYKARLSSQDALQDKWLNEKPKDASLHSTNETRS